MLALGLLCRMKDGAMKVRADRRSVADGCGCCDLSAYIRMMMSDRQIHFSFCFGEWREEILDYSLILAAE